MLRLLLFIVTVSTVSALVPVYTRCAQANNNNCVVSEVRINPCTDPKFCAVVKGESSSIQFDFIPKFQSSNLQTGVYWAQGANEAPFRDLDSDGCKFTKCPTVANETQTFDYSLIIGTILPSGKFKIRWKLWDADDQNNMCCFETNIKITRKF